MIMGRNKFNAAMAVVESVRKRYYPLSVPILAVKKTSRIGRLIFRYPVQRIVETVVVMEHGCMNELCTSDYFEPA